MIEPCEEVKRVEQRYEKALDDMEKRYKDVLDKIREEIENLNPVDYGSMFSYESHNGAKYMKDDVLCIIDRYGK